MEKIKQMIMLFIKQLRCKHKSTVLHSINVGKGISRRRCNNCDKIISEDADFTGTFFEV